MRPARRWLVIGIGNPDRGDDGAGIVVIRYLQALGSDPTNLMEWTGPLDRLLDLWAGREWVTVVDAVASGAPVGTIHRWEEEDWEQIPVPGSPVSSHGLGLSEVLHLAKSLRCLPQSLVVVGIEGRRFGWQDPMSPEVAQAARIVARQIFEELRDRGFVTSSTESMV